MGRGKGAGPGRGTKKKPATRAPAPSPRSEVDEVKGTIKDQPDESCKLSPADSGIFSFSDGDSGEEPAGDTDTKVDNHPGQDDSSDSGMFEGGTYGLKVTRKASGTEIASSAGGPRRSKKQEYKNQVYIRDFVVSHVTDWMQFADPTFLNRDRFRGLSRTTVMGALLFCSGLQPGDLKPGKNFQEVADVVKSRYELRGRPAAYTGWSPSDMRKHSAWQLEELASKRLRTSQLGGSSWELPRRLEDGKPAPLPETVLRHVPRLDSVGNRSESEGRPPSMRSASPRHRQAPAARKPKEDTRPRRSRSPAGKPAKAKDTRQSRRSRSPAGKPAKAKDTRHGRSRSPAGKLAKAKDESARSRSPQATRRPSASPGRSGRRSAHAAKPAANSKAKVKPVAKRGKLMPGMERKGTGEQDDVKNDGGGHGRDRDDFFLWGNRTEKSRANPKTHFFTQREEEKPSCLTRFPKKKLLLPDIDQPDMWVVRRDDDDEWILCCSYDTYSAKLVKKVMTHQKAESWSPEWPGKLGKSSKHPRTRKEEDAPTPDYYSQNLLRAKKESAHPTKKQTHEERKKAEDNARLKEEEKLKRQKYESRMAEKAARDAAEKQLAEAHRREAQRSREEADDKKQKASEQRIRLARERSGKSNEQKLAQREKEEAAKREEQKVEEKKRIQREADRQKQKEKAAASRRGQELEEAKQKQKKETAKSDGKRKQNEEKEEDKKRQVLKEQEELKRREHQDQKDERRRKEKESQERKKAEQRSKEDAKEPKQEGSTETPGRRLRRLRPDDAEAETPSKKHRRETTSTGGLQETEGETKADDGKGKAATRDDGSEAEDDKAGLQTPQENEENEQTDVEQGDEAEGEEEEEEPANGGFPFEDDEEFEDKDFEDPDGSEKGDGQGKGDKDTGGNDPGRHGRDDKDDSDKGSDKGGSEGGSDKGDHESGRHGRDKEDKDGSDKDCSKEESLFGNGSAEEEPEDLTGKKEEQEEKEDGGEEKEDQKEEKEETEKEKNEEVQKSPSPLKVPQEEADLKALKGLTSPEKRNKERVLQDTGSPSLDELLSRNDEKDWGATPGERRKSSRVDFFGSSDAATADLQ